MSKIVTVFVSCPGKSEKRYYSGPKTYLKALVGSLATSDVFASVGDDDDGDFVVVASEELLCSANNVSDDDSGAQREDDVLVVRVQNQALVDLAYKEKVS